MSNEAQPARPSILAQERRQFARRGLKSLAYIDLGDDSGGIVLNISEGGLAVHSAVALTQRALPSLRFQLPNSPDWVAARGDIAWINASRKEAGIRFAVLPDGARTHIREWVTSSDDSIIGDDTPVGRMQLASLKLGRVPAIRPGNSLPRETESVDRKLRLHFAARDAASARPSRTARGVWWALVFAVAVLAVLSFGFGWIAGHGRVDDLSAAFARIAGRTVARAPQAQRALPDPVATAPATPKAAASDGTGAALPAAPGLLPRITFTTRDYVPVSGEDRAGGRVRMLELGKLVHRVDPGYPEQALSQHIEGTVQLRATISAEGQVDAVSFVSGDPTLASAAEDAVRQWRYAPTLLDGTPVPTEQVISIVFSLPK